MDVKAGSVYLANGLGIVALSPMSPEHIGSYEDRSDLRDARFTGRLLSERGSYLYDADGKVCLVRVEDNEDSTYGQLIEEIEGAITFHKGYSALIAGKIPLGSYAITLTEDGFTAKRIPYEFEPCPKETETVIVDVRNNGHIPFDL